MMANIYGVGAQHSAPRKGYRDFVQHTGTMVSGQLRLVLNESQTFRVSLSDAQTLPVTFGYSQDQTANMQSANNSLKMFQRTKLSLAQILRNSLKVAQASRNSLMGFNYRGSREMANSLILPQTCTAVSRYNLLNVSGNAAGVCRETKHGGSPSLEVPTKSAATGTPCMRNISHTPNQQITGKEKGRTANATLWDDCFFNHEENQHSPVLDGGRKPNLAYEENQYLAEPQDNYITLSDLVQRLQPSFSQSQNHTEISGEVQPWRRGVLQKFRKTSTCVTYEAFVGHKVSGSKPVQPSGASLPFLRWSSLRAIPTSCLISLPALMPISSTRARALSEESRVFSPDASTWRRVISPCIAVAMKPAVDSPACFTASIPSIMSWGTRAVNDCDFAFFEPVAINLHSSFWCMTVYTKTNYTKELTCKTLGTNFTYTLTVSGCKNTKPRRCSNTGRASNHNVIGANTMACQHSTQTRPKFVFLFLGTPNEFPNTTPTVLRVEADTEDEGRAKFVGWTLIFAAQIRTEAPCRLQLFSTDEGFMWVYEQRQTVKESSHA